jgi:hypothetical protein
MWGTRLIVYYYEDNPHWLQIGFGTGVGYRHASIIRIQIPSLIKHIKRNMRRKVIEIQSTSQNHLDPLLIPHDVAPALMKSLRQYLHEKV